MQCTKHCPNRRDGSGQGSGHWEVVWGAEGSFQPFTLEETESPRGLGGLSGQAGQQESVQGICLQNV